MLLEDGLLLFQVGERKTDSSDGAPRGYIKRMGELPFSWVPAAQEASLIAKQVKNLPSMQETWVRSLRREEPLVKEMATHSSILAGRIPWTEEPGRLQSMGLQESDTT